MKRNLLSLVVCILVVFICGVVPKRSTAQQTAEGAVYSEDFGNYSSSSYGDYSYGNVYTSNISSSTYGIANIVQYKGGNSGHSFRGWPNEGEYVLASWTKAPGGSSVQLTDHTNSDVSNKKGGSFLVFNANASGSGTYMQKTISIPCTGISRFRFVAWLASASDLGPNNSGQFQMPNVTFKIFNGSTTNGTLLGSVSTGNFAGSTIIKDGDTYGVWSPFSVDFTAPSNTVTIQLVNNITSGITNGNDIGLDDISITALGQDNQAAITPQVSTVLNGETQSLTADITSNYASAFQWQGSTVPDFSSVTALNSSSATSYTTSPINAATYYRVKYAGSSADLSNQACYFYSNTALVKVASSSTVNCDNPTSATGSNGLLGWVSNTSSAIDGNNTTAATMNSLVSLLGVFGSSSLSVELPDYGTAGDTLHVITNNTGTSLLSLLNGVSVKFYNSDGSTTVQTQFTLIDLVGLSAGLKDIQVVNPDSKAYVKVDITFVSAVGILNSFSVYEVYRTPKKVTITSTNTKLCTDLTSITAQVSPLGDGTRTNYNWTWATNPDFTQPTQIANTVSNNTSNSEITINNLSEGQHTFYVQAENQVCTNRIGKDTIIVTVYKSPTITPVNNSILSTATRNSSYNSTNTITTDAGTFSSFTQDPFDAGFAFVTGGSSSHFTSTSVNGNATASLSSIPVTVTAINNGCSSTVNYQIPLSSVLPVFYSKELSANVVNGTVVLTWSTATEINNKYFEVQRTKDQSNWTSIGTVKSNLPNGSGNGADYSYTDYSPLDGITNYRLVQYDQDGSSKTSKVVSVDIINTSKVKIYPNPADDKIQVMGISIGTKLNIYSIDGKLVKSQIATSLPDVVNVQSLPSGVYLIQIIKDNQVKETTKFIKR